MNSFSKLEKKALIVSIIAILAFIGTRVLREFIYFFYNETHFLLYHTALELFSIFVSVSIFFLGWLTFPHNHSNSRMILSLVFLSVGTFDLFHTLSYKGMPFFQSDPLATATWLWIFARLTESIGLLCVLTISARSKISTTTRNWYVGFTFIYILVVVSFVLTSASSLPVLVVAGTGVTSFKISLEYIITLFHLMSLLFVIRLYKKTNRADLLTVAIGVVFIIISELVFTLYHHVYDLDNLLGHLYKVAGYYYLLKGIFFPQFKQLFIEKYAAEEKWHSAELKLIEQEKKMTSLVMEAQENERKRVSRELHDGVGQLLYSILMMLKFFKKSVKDEKMINELENIERITDDTMEEVKNIAHQLRPSSLDDLGFIPAIRSHIEQYRQTFQIDVELKIEGYQKRLHPDIETALFRICQEALNNAAKYSKASSIEVSIVIVNHEVQLTIEDNGVGFNLQDVRERASQGLGLYGIKERATLIDGQAEIFSTENVGTKIYIRVPIEDK